MSMQNLNWSLSSPIIKPEYESVLLDVEGMKCGGCLRAVEKTLLDQENVESASVNLVQRTALIEIKNKNENIENIVTALTDRGFPAKQRESNQPINTEESSSTKKFWKQLIIAFILLLLSVIYFG